MYSSWQHEDDREEELKMNGGDMPSLFEEAPLMRSIAMPSFNDLNAPTVRDAMGDVMFEQRGYVGGMSWGYDESEDYSPFGASQQGKVLERDINQLKLGTAGNLWAHTQIVSAPSPTISNTKQETVPLEDVPFYIEKHTSFVSNSTSELLISALGAIFEAIRVDAEPFSHKHRMKGFAYDATRAGKVSFRVQIYKGEREGERVCEFQRRSGCVVAFHAFYARALESLDTHVLRRFEEAAAPAKQAAPKDSPLSLTPPPLARSSGSAVSLDTNTLQALLAMATSSNCDVQHEGLTALAAVTADPVNQRALIEAHQRGLVDLVGTLEIVLASPEEHLRRIAALLLANVCQQERVRSAVAKLVPLMLEELDAPAALDNRETKRHVAAALAALSGTHSDTFPRNIEALARFSQCQDAVLRKNVNVAIANHRNQIRGF